MQTKEQLAKQAINRGKTMGQFLRDLDPSEKMSKAELQEYAKAYVKVREEAKA
jgi:hypothetical protein